MFEFIRSHQRWMQILLALLIVPSFVLVGVSSYDKSNTGAEVAVVDGQKITQQEWEEAQRQQMERYRGMMGAQFDAKLFENPQVKQGILENLVAERSLAAEVARNHMTVGDAALQSSIMQYEQFRKDDGSFDKERYLGALAAQGMTAKVYEARLRRDLTLQQLNSAIASSAFAPRSVATRLSEINDQEREAQELLFPAATYAAQVKVTDDMVKAFYDKNAALFQIPEQVKAEYVVLNAAAVESQISVPDAEIEAFYNANKDKFGQPEQRTASHILISVKKDASAADKAAAKAKADAILADLRKAPASFAAVAKAKSQDPGSAEAGGDLGVVEKGAFVKSVEDAIYALKQGEISNVVESEFGYHIITVPTVTPAKIKTLEEAKPQIAAELKKGKASKKFSEMAEVFTNTVYEQSDSLKPVADKLGLKVESAAAVSRNPSPQLGESPVNNAKFLKALFADDTLKNKRNTEAVEVAPSTLVAGRVVEYKPAAKRPLAEVEPLIRQRVTQEEAAKLARAAGEKKLAEVKASGDAAGFGEVKVVSRTKEPPFNQTAAIAVLKADVSKLPAYVGVDVPGTGYAIYRIGKVAQAEKPDLARRAQEQQQITNAIGQEEMFSYVEALKQKSKAKMLVKNGTEVKVEPVAK